MSDTAQPILRPPGLVSGATPMTVSQAFNAGERFGIASTKVGKGMAEGPRAVWSAAAVLAVALAVIMSIAALAMATHQYIRKPDAITLANGAQLQVTPDSSGMQVVVEGKPVQVFGATDNYSLRRSWALDGLGFDNGMYVQGHQNGAGKAYLQVGGGEGLEVKQIHAGGVDANIVMERGVQLYNYTPKTAPTQPVNSWTSTTTPPVTPPPVAPPVIVTPPPQAPSATTSPYIFCKAGFDLAHGGFSFPTPSDGDSFMVVETGLDTSNWPLLAILPFAGGGKLYANKQVNILAGTMSTGVLPVFTPTLTLAVTTAGYNAHDITTSLGWVPYSSADMGKRHGWVLSLSGDSTSTNEIVLPTSGSQVVQCNLGTNLDGSLNWMGEYFRYIVFNGAGSNILYLGRQGITGDASTDFITTMDS